MSHISSAPSISDTTPPLCIPQLLAERSERTPDALALLAPGRPPLTYGRLRRHMDDVVQTLYTMGLGCGDRVALVLPSGPELAVAALTVAAGATCAPLNPAYNADEYAFHLTDLRIQALIVQEGMESPVRTVAHTHGIRVIELRPSQAAEAGLFTLISTSLQRPGIPAYAQSSDVALVMHTSGTTARPKIVPLTHANICVSAHHMRTALSLVERDRYLSVMPLFHCAGLVLGILASLVAGASAVCPPRFDASQFFT
jgi:acyl-CoA synthetase (AMP-forming)/AMP-acid ligase II